MHCFIKRTPEIISLIFLLLIPISCSDRGTNTDNGENTEKRELGVFYKWTDPLLIKNSHETISTIKDTITDDNGYLKEIEIGYRIGTRASFYEENKGHTNRSWTANFYIGSSRETLQSSGSWGSFGYEAWRYMNYLDDTENAYVVWKKNDKDTIYVVGIRLKN